MHADLQWTMPKASRISSRDGEVIGGFTLSFYCYLEHNFVYKQLANVLGTLAVHQNRKTKDIVTVSILLGDSQVVSNGVINLAVVI